MLELKNPLSLVLFALNNFLHNLSLKPDRVLRIGLLLLEQAIIIINNLFKRIFTLPYMKMELLLSSLRSHVIMLPRKCDTKE